MNENCEWTHARLSAAHDGALSGGEKVGVDEHLAVCGECRAVMEEIRRADEMMGPHGPFPGPTLSTQDLIGRLHVHLERERQTAAAPWWRTAFARGIAFALAGGLAVMLVTFRSTPVAAPPDGTPVVVVATRKAVEVPPVTAKKIGSTRIHKEIEEIQRELAGLDQEFARFHEEARRLAGEHDRQVADRRFAEWK